MTEKQVEMGTCQSRGQLCRQYPPHSRQSRQTILKLFQRVTESLNSRYESIKTQKLQDNSFAAIPICEKEE